jgi:SAM-dependent methyltransferase
MEAQIIRFLNTAESYRIWREEMPDEMRNSRMPMYRERAQHLLDKAGRPKSVLEVGAGNGEMLGLLKGEVPRLLAVDPQPLPVAIPGVEVICGSFADIKIPYAVDVVVAFEVFEHLVEPEKFLSFARRGLNAPGLLIMSMPNGCGFEISQLGPLSSSVPFDHVALYNPGSLKLLLERNGFCDVSIETPGRFDAEMVYDAFRLGQIKIEDPALRFVLTAGEAMRNDFQAFLREGRLSSHMRVVARAH